MKKREKTRINQYIVFILMSLLVVSLIMMPTTSFAAADMDLYNRAEQVQESILRDLGTLVNIETPSGYDLGLTKLKEIVVEQLQELGADVTTIASPRGGHNIVAVFRGNGKGSVLMFAHADTVFNVGSLEKNPFRIADHKAHGPGVIDCKSNILIGMYAMKLLKERDFCDYAKITFVINCDEEVGSPSSKGLLQQLAKEHDYAICLESGAPGGKNKITGWRKGLASIKVEVKGKATHAGSPENGVNALIELANQVLQYNKLNDREKGTTVSVTIFKAGDKTNVVPDYAMATIDVRAVTEEDLTQVEKAAAEIAGSKLLPDAEVIYTFNIRRPAYSYTAGNQALAGKVKDIYHDLGQEMTVGSSYGGTDANFTALTGTPTLDGMGFCGGREHTMDEYLELNSMPKRLYVLTKLLMELGGGGQE